MINLLMRVQMFIEILEENKGMRENLKMVENIKRMR